MNDHNAFERKTNDIGPLTDMVKQADLDYRAAKDREALARRDATAAMNALNEAQRALDAAIKELRSLAPNDSDWKREKGRPVSVNG